MGLNIILPSVFRALSPECEAAILWGVEPSGGGWHFGESEIVLPYCARLAMTEVFLRIGEFWNRVSRRVNYASSILLIHRATCQVFNQNLYDERRLNRLYTTQ